MTLKYIVWDLDGTLINSEEEVLFHLKNAIQLNASIEFFDQTKLRIGPTVDEILLEACPDITQELLNRIIKSFRNSYDNSDFKYTFKVTGVEDILVEYEDIKHIIITNKPLIPTEKILLKLHWSKFFTEILTPYDSIGERKLSKIELFKNITQKYCLDYSNTISIGDMKTDCIAAKKSNLFTVGVLWGTGTIDELTESFCDKIFDNVDDLKIFMQSFGKNL